MSPRRATGACVCARVCERVRVAGGVAEKGGSSVAGRECVSGVARLRALPCQSTLPPSTITFLPASPCLPDSHHPVPHVGGRCLRCITPTIAAHAVAAAGGVVEDLPGLPDLRKPDQQAARHR